jgi:GntR family transcriptional regulator/MocR family aminotransferase
VNSRCAFDLDNLKVDRNSAVPIHRQIYSAIRAYILDGRLGPDMSLPATRALAQSLRVGRNTVVAAYDQLLAEGYVETRVGSRTFVTNLHGRNPAIRRSHAVGPTRRLSRRGELIASRAQPQRTPGTLNLYPGVPDTSEFPFAAWTSLMARNARRRDDDILGIHAFAGHPRLRQTIADYLSVARNIECTAEQVIVVTGAQAALDLSARVLMDEGDVAWMEEPGYLGARSALIGAGAHLAPLRTSRQGWALEDDELPSPRLIYVTPSCQWPFGTIMRMEERLRLLALANQHGAWIVEDDYDGEYRFRGEPVPALRGLDGTERVIYVGTFGKTMFSSLRMGFLVVPTELADAFNRAISVTGQFAPSLLQVTVADFIRDGHFATHLKRMRRLYARRQALFLELSRTHLRHWIGVAENDSGLQLFGHFTRALDDCRIASAALHQGVNVQPVSINYHHDKASHGLLLGYAALDEREMIKAIDALRRAFLECDKNGPALRSARWSPQNMAKWLY